MNMKFTLAAMLGGLVVATGLSFTPAQAQSGFCDREARHYANRRADVAGNVVGGAAVGAATGAIIGAIVGNGRSAGRGAAIGAGAGAFGGAVHHTNKWQRAYDYAYQDCLERRAHLRRSQHRAVYRGAPPAWSDEWYDYCAAKYRSFNPETGRYLTYSGKYKLCR